MTAFISLDGQVAFLDVQIGPDMLQQFRLGHHPACIRMKMGQHVKSASADDQIRSVDPEPAQVPQKLDIGLNGIGHRKFQEWMPEQR